jgi:glutathione S-transferase
MITLYTFGKAFGLPDPSPFVTKADVLLKMSGIAYTSTIGNMRTAPKRKLPYIDDDGAKIADSTFIRLHLETKRGVDFDKHLSNYEKGIAWAVEKMLEEQLYWAIIHERWLVDENFHKGPAIFFATVPGLIRPLITSMVRKRIRKNLYGHGIGRHTRDEIITLASRAIDSLAQVLGDKTYLMGDQKCGADATVFAFVMGALAPSFDTPLRMHMEQHRNLIAYYERMKLEFYPNS